MPVLALALALSLATQLDLDKHVTITDPAMSAKQLAQSLGRQLGTELLTSTEVSNEMIVVYAKDVTAKSLMDQVAKAMHAQWIPDNQTLRLVRTAEQRKADQEVADKQEADILQKGLDELKNKAAAQAAFNEGDALKLAAKMNDLQSRKEEGSIQNYVAQISLLDQQTPIGRAAPRILASFERASLLAIPINKRIVFSSAPNKMQRAFPQKASRELAKYVLEQNEWAKAAGQVFTKPPTGDSAGGSSLRDPVTGGLGKAILVASRFAGSGIGYTLYISNKAGAIVGRAQGYIVASGSEPQPAIEKPDPTPLQLSETTREFFARARWLQSTPSDTPLSPAASELLLHPEKTDPLALWTTDLLQSYTRARSRNLVATVSDNTAFELALGQSGTETVGRFQQRLRGTGYREEEEDGWLRISRIFPGKDRIPNMDRPALGTFLRAVDKKKRIEFEDLAEFAFKSPVPYFSILGPALTAFVLNDQREFYKFNSKFEAYRLYGSLTTSQKAASPREPLPLSTLTEAQQDVLQRLVYEGQGMLVVAIADEAGQKFSVSGPGQYLQGEVTEALPDGLPSATTWSFPREGETVVFVDTQEGTPGSALNAQSYAYRLYAQSQPNAQELLGPVRYNLETVRVGQQIRHILDASLTPDIHLDIVFQDETLGPKQPYAQAPADFKAEVEAALAKLRKQKLG